MRERLNTWLQEAPLPEGVLAAAIRFPDQSTCVRIQDDSVTAGALDNASRCAGDVFRVLKVHRLPSLLLRWGFQGGILHCARRPEDIVLVLLAPAGTDVSALQVEFLQVSA